MQCSWQTFSGAPLGVLSVLCPSRAHSCLRLCWRFWLLYFLLRITLFGWFPMLVGLPFYWFPNCFLNKCENSYCCFWINDRYVLEGFTVDENGHCREYVYPEIPEKYLSAGERKGALSPKSTRGKAVKRSSIPWVKSWGINGDFSGL